MNNDGGTGREGQMMLYQITVQDLTYFKSQQWAVTNYCFLLLAGLVATRALLKPVHQWHLIALSALAVGVVILGLVLLSKLQRSIQVRQKRLDAAREKLGLDFYETWAAEEKGKEYIHAVWILCAALIVACAVACVLLLQPV